MSKYTTINIDGVCQRFGGNKPVHRATIYRAVQAGILPKPIKFGRIARWRVDEVEEVLERLADARNHSQ